jgi:hypothetical protein
VSRQKTQFPGVKTSKADGSNNNDLQECKQNNAKQMQATTTIKIKTNKKYKNGIQKTMTINFKYINFKQRFRESRQHRQQRQSVRHHRHQRT